MPSGQHHHLWPNHNIVTNFNLIHTNKKGILS